MEPEIELDGRNKSNASNSNQIYNGRETETLAGGLNARFLKSDKLFPSSGKGAIFAIGPDIDLLN